LAVEGPFKASASMLWRFFHRHRISIKENAAGLPSRSAPLLQCLDLLLHRFENRGEHGSRQMRNVLAVGDGRLDAIPD
jgi:hypothetical protein